MAKLFKLGFKSFESVSRTLTGIEMIRMIKKRQLSFPLVTYFKTFCALTA
jgi:transposase-like protein